MRVLLPPRPVCQGTGTLIPRWHPQSTRWLFTSKSHCSVLLGSPIATSKSRQRLKSTSAAQRFRVKKATSKASDDVWPLRILLDAHKLGLLKITVDAAIGVMRDFNGSQPLSAENICKKHDIRPSDITLLAHVLLRTEHISMAREMLMAAARLRDEEATLFVIQEAIRRDSLGAPGVDAIYKGHFTKLVEIENPRALLLQGQLHERRGNLRQAFHLYEQLLASDLGKRTDTDHKVEFGDAWIALGKLKLRVKKGHEGAERAIRKAALEYGNPAAYYELGKVFTPPSSAEYENYMLKAAASGEAEAAHELGKLYFAQAQGKIPSNDLNNSKASTKATSGGTEIGLFRNDSRLALSASTALEKRDLARQWFTISAESDITGSQVYLAVLLHKFGKFAEGLQWLKAASDSRNSKDWKKAVTFLSERWTVDHFDFAGMDIEGLREGLSVDCTEIEHAG